MKKALHTTNNSIKKIIISFFYIISFVITINANNEIPRDSLLISYTEPLKKLPANFLTELNLQVKTNQFHYKNVMSEFTNDYIKKNFALSSTTNEAMLEAKAVIDELEVSQNYIDLVSPDDLVTLPVGIKTTIGNITYILGISKATFTPEYTEVTAFVRIVLPQLGADGQQQQIFFGANNIKLSHSGGIYGESNLVLLGDVAIPINGGNAMVVLKGGFDMNTGNVTQKTYVTIDCSGFQELGIEADVMFPRSMLEPVNPSNNYAVYPDENIKVVGNFQTVVSDWNDILAEISLPPFQLTKNDSPDDGTGKAGLIFELNTAVFDFSDLKNSDSIVFPSGYDNFPIPGDQNSWRGVYVNTLSVVLPKEFKKKSSTERVTFEATNLLIDSQGITGNFAVDNILPLNEGEASKWQFSVDHIEVDLLANQVTEAGFDGKIVLPVTEKVTNDEIQNTNTTDLDAKALNYDAIMDIANDEYTLSISLQNNLSFNVFKAKATLESNSFVELTVSDNEFKPRAVLHGSLEIKGSNTETTSGKPTVDFKGITFTNLQLQTESPYFQVDNMNMGYDGEVKMANFPVTLSNIGVTANDTTASLKFDVAVNLMGENNGFAGNTTLTIVGEYGEAEGLSHWQFDHIDVNQISLEVDLGNIQINGFVDIKTDDPIYGDGFYGELGATFNGISVDATAMFGKTDIRYWYVDAFADLSSTGVAIGPLLINGFGGGAYYHMTTNTNATMPIYDGEPVKMGPISPSGKSYVPDANAGLGFRALIGFALGNKKAFNGKVGFEMAFNTSMGLDRVLFFGEAHIVKTLDFGFGSQFKDKLTAMEDQISGIDPAMDALKESNLIEYSVAAFPQNGLTFDAGIDANFAMTMDIENHSFHSTMDIFVNTPGGFFKGTGANGRAGWSVLHIDEDSWYLHAGNPTDRLGLQLGLGSFNVQATTYLMIGDNIPESPAPPAEVAAILGVQLDELDSNSLGEGSGFAFGAAIQMNTGDMTFLVFYASFKAGIGFDIMLKDYGDAACEGSGPIGVDGWYASGQAYAYLQGELGIKIKLLGKTKKIPIVSAGAAVLLQAKLPNPAWFKGYVGGYYSILGGLVEGQFNFKVELGDECEIIGGGPLAGMKIISNISPDDGDTEVDVFTVPQVAFNMKINQPFELEDDNGVKTYRILLEQFSCTNAGTETEIPGDITWNDANNRLNFMAFDILPPETELNITVKVKFQERISGVWTTLTEDGEVALEIEERTFTTGVAPDYIPLANIKYCYPVIDQKYFYKGERNTGYVKLVKGQPYLFTPGTDWTQKIRFESNGNVETLTQISYNTSERTVNFNLPNLLNQQEYNLKIISSPPASDDTDDTDDNYTSQDTGQEGNTINIRNRQAQDVISDDIEETQILAYDFTTSSYDTFADKINDKDLIRSL
ncbi:MAG TPA: hypothetical protein EYG92_10945, partial [Lutibacter sp.]|nr:hypothetical protein [Lutibacter sp.]